MSDEPPAVPSERPASERRSSERLRGQGLGWACLALVGLALVLYVVVAAATFTVGGLTEAGLERSERYGRLVVGALGALVAGVVGGTLRLATRRRGGPGAVRAVGLLVVLGVASVVIGVTRFLLA